MPSIRLTPTTRPDPKGASILLQLDRGCVSRRPAVCWGREGLTWQHLVNVLPHCIEAACSVMESKTLSRDDDS
eukprot:1340069-Rhodomonas_salina.1